MNQHTEALLEIDIDEFRERYGSCLGCVTRSDPQGKDVHFWV